MKYYKYVVNGYIVCIGTGGMGKEINEDEYRALLSVVREKPARTNLFDYRLREDLTWDEYAIEVSNFDNVFVWKQPTGTDDAYMVGDKVHYPDENGPVYVCIYDYITYAPDVYGWEVFE